jgi:hypothetical protein
MIVPRDTSRTTDPRKKKPTGNTPSPIKEYHPAIPIGFSLSTSLHLDTRPPAYNFGEIGPPRQSTMCFRVRGMRSYGQTSKIPQVSAEMR